MSPKTATINLVCSECGEDVSKDAEVIFFPPSFRLMCLACDASEADLEDEDFDDFDDD